MTLRQPFLQRRRQKEELVRIVGLVVHTHGLTPCFSFILQGIKGLWEEEYSDRLLEATSCQAAVRWRRRASPPYSRYVDRSAVAGFLPIRAVFCATQKQDQPYCLCDILLPEFAVKQLRVGQEAKTGFLPSQVDSCFQSSVNPVIFSLCSG